ncbi:uncharacterized protein [Coffea arabica]|uniref:Transposon Ty3-I Gag-Pol polyprotein n=1 Tax=Coffea arabica TaxID=13443 RepID=A0ABM4V9M2_COFAR
MRKRFIPGHYHRDLHHKLQILTQDSMTVEDYFKEMEMSMMQADVREDEEATMAQFLGGLRPDIADIVEFQHYLDMGELLDNAIKIERRFKRRGTSRQNSNFQSGNWRHASLKREDHPSSAPHLAKSNGNSRGTLRPNTLPSKPTSRKDILTDEEEEEHEGMPPLEEEDELEEEYHDVFPEDIPNGLPPLRGIEHQIDFIPGASLPNKAPYRTNPEETKEQQRQVEELLGKGWIRESLSPCAVLVLLVPKKDGGWRICIDCRAINAITARLYANLKKCTFCTDQLVFLGYVISAQGVQVDQSKVKAINEWPTPSNGFLYYKNKLFIPLNSMRPVLVREAHGGGLIGHFGVTMTLSTLQEHFFWPCIKRDVERHIQSHPQTDGQTEVVNSTLSTLLRATIEKNIKTWENCLPHVEFAYNRSVHTATLHLSPLPEHERVNMDGKKKVEFVRDLYAKVRANIEKRTLQYIQNANKGRCKMVFEPGDWVWIHMRKERFPLQRRNKLQPRGDGPFQVVEKINDNAYKLDLPSEYVVHATFNVADLSPFYADDEFDLVTNCLQEERTDEGAPRINGDHDQVIQVPLGPVTRARAKKMRESLQALVCTIQERIGDDLKTIEGLENEDSTIHTLLQVDEPSEA